MPLIESEALRELKISSDISNAKPWSGVVLGKADRSAVPKISHSWSTEMLRLFYSDVNLPIKVPSLDDSRYIATVHHLCNKEKNLKQCWKEEGLLRKCQVRWVYLSYRQLMYRMIFRMILSVTFSIVSTMPKADLDSIRLVIHAWFIRKSGMISESSGNHYAT